jgi:hypothetical protein
MHAAGGGVLTGSCSNQSLTTVSATWFQQLPHSLLLLLLLRNCLALHNSWHSSSLLLLLLLQPLASSHVSRH